MKSLDQLGQDKIGHLYVGSQISLGTTFVSALGGCPTPIVAGIVTATLAGIAKEIYDHWLNVRFYKDNPKWMTPPHTVEMADIVATAIGSLVAPAGLFWLYRRYR